MIKTHFNGWLMIGLATLLLSIAVVAWANQVDSQKPADPQWMAAEFAVSGMTCGGCIYTIQQSLKPLEGIQKVAVDLRGQKVSTIYDSSKLYDPQLIAKAITDSGYPATLTHQAPSEEDFTQETPSPQGSTGVGGGCACCSG